MRVDPDPLLSRVDRLVVERTGRVVLAFLVLTAVFAVGLGNISTATGTDQFTSDLPAQEALEDIEREFGTPFAASTAGTSLIQHNQNVLSKPALLRMLHTHERILDREGLRVASTSSPARVVARQLDPQAATIDEEITAVERATPGEIDAAVRRAATNSGFTGSLSNDFNRESATASAAIGAVSHRLPDGVESDDPLVTDLQLETKRVVAAQSNGITVFGSGIINDEFSRVIFDSLALVVPAALLLILFFLVVAYRDPIDLLLGLAALLMAIVWTFGFMGLAGIPFSQMLIAVPPLLLAVGIDFGIHAVNRYREERTAGVESEPAMKTTIHQLLVAFFLVTGTTVIGFSANVTSALTPIREFGIVASVGITFTFLIFGVFLPAAKLYADRVRERRGFPSFKSTPLGSEGSLLGRILPAGVVAGRAAPRLFLAVVLLVSASAGVYATGVDTSFAQEDFLPPEDVPDYLESLPEPFAPGTYTVTAQLNFLEDNFAAGSQQSVTIYLQGPMERDHALESLHRAARDPPDTFLREDGYAQSESIVAVIQSRAAADPEFRRLVDRNDRNDNGVPDEDLDQVYDALLDSPARDQTLRYLSESRRSARVVYTVEGDAAQDAVVADAHEVADAHRYEAIPTGQTVVFDAVSGLIFRSALNSLAIAITLTAVFLVLIYGLLNGRPFMGLVNLFPILVTIALIGGSMRLFGIPFNALTATILSITIGLGVDYSVHVAHRFLDEYDLEGKDLFPALAATVRGTGGALTGSMLTTVSGIGVLTIAITPILGQFGIITALSVFYSYLTSILLIPPAIVLWARWVDGSITTADEPVGGEADPSA